MKKFYILALAFLTGISTIVGSGSFQREKKSKKTLEFKESPPIVSINSENYEVETTANLVLDSKDFGVDSGIKRSTLYENGKIIGFWFGEPKDTSIKRKKGRYSYELVSEDLAGNKANDKLKILFLGKDLPKISLFTRDSVGRNNLIRFKSEKPSLESKVKHVSLYENGEKIKTWKGIPNSYFLTKEENKEYRYHLETETFEGDKIISESVKVSYHGLVDNFPESKINFNGYFIVENGNSRSSNLGGLFLKGEDRGYNAGVIYSALYRDNEKIMDWNGEPPKKPITLRKSDKFHEYKLMVMDKSNQKSFSKIKLKYFIKE